MEKLIKALSNKTQKFEMGNKIGEQHPTNHVP